MLGSSGKTSITLLASKLDVSLPTIRRDLTYLESQGRIARGYGVAWLTQPSGVVSQSYAERAKAAICAYAAELIKPGDMIFIGGGTTAIGILSHIAVEGVTVLTNNLHVLSSRRPPKLTILLTGGELLESHTSLSGETSLVSLSGVRLSTAFIGCEAISPDFGISAGYVQGVSLTSRAMAGSEQTVLLADSSKVKDEAGFKIADVSEINRFVTDDRISPDAVRRLSEAGLSEIDQITVEPSHDMAM